MITLSSFFHRGEKNIRIDFERDNKVYAAIRNLPAVKYTKTHRCYYIPYTTEAYKALKSIGIPQKIQSEKHQIDQELTQKRSLSSLSSSSSSSSSSTSSHQNSEVTEKIKPLSANHVEINYYNQRFWIKMRYQIDDITMVKSLSGAYWNKNQKLWCAGGTEGNLRKMQTYFNYWSPETYTHIYGLIMTTADPKIIEIYRTPEFKDIICIKLKGYNNDTHFVTQIPNAKYDLEYKRWLLPNNELLISSVQSHYESKGVKVINRLCQKGKLYKKKDYNNQEKQSNLMAKYPAKHAALLQQYTDAMIRRNNSWSTIYTYTPEIVKFAETLGVQNIAKANETTINQYLSQLSGKKIAVSTIHTAINAIKYYYQKVIYRQDLKIDQLSRPKKGFHLPTILSAQETNGLLECITNTKHIVLLYILYGSGLRLNESLAVRVEDVWWDRNQLIVRGGKGNKDRVVMLSQTLKQLLRKYFDEYMPQQWLFEGQDMMTQYSVRSVQKVVKNAAYKAGISKKVTPHTLRHCFATHLLDSGVQLPYIQALLGHKDVKTTMIYTHVTTQSIAHVVSPLDRLSSSGLRL
jgi:site-specific recombinase XerD